jgi:shikimate dehydrogenase
MAPITGATRLFGIFADPIHQVKTPQVMNAFFSARGVDAVMVPFHVPPIGLASLLAGLRDVENFGGFIATVPHKPAMIGLCDEVTMHAGLIGAANCIRREADGRLVGAMLDGVGFVAGLRRAAIEPAGRAVLVIGAGGAASAIAFAMAEAGAASVTIMNRTEAKAIDLAARIAAAFPGVTTGVGTEQLYRQDLIVNGTSLGMRQDDPLPLDITGLHGGQIVAEAIMEPSETRLLAAALARGCRIQPGLPMLECQIELMARHLGAIP